MTFSDRESRVRGVCSGTKKALECCAHLGIPVAPLKTHGPTTKLVFLGIEIDTEARRVRLPEAKLHGYRRRSGCGRAGEHVRRESCCP